MPRRLHDNEGIRFVVDEFPDESFNLFSEAELARLLAVPPESRIVKHSIYKSSEFEFYKQEISFNQFEYFVEDLVNHKKANLDFAMKEGEVEGKDIDPVMYDFLHDFDETLD